MTSRFGRSFSVADAPLALVAALVIVLAACGGGEKPCIERVEADADLRGCDLSGGNLSGADLNGTDLASANLDGADLSDANLEEANLQSAAMRGADLSGANLRAADLSGSDLTEAIAIGTVFRESDLTGATLASGDFSDAEFFAADLTGADLTSADFTRAVMTQAEMPEVNLTAATLRSADLTEANLVGATIVRAGLDDSIAAGANLTDSDLSASVLTNADLTGADLRSANVSSAVLTAATLTDARLEGATFKENALDSAILTGAVGLTEEQLQAALRVSAEALGAALLQHQVQLNRPNDIWSGVQAACSGQSVPGTALHLGGPGVHPAVALNHEGATHPWTSRVAPPTALRSVELVACIGAEEEVLFANCGTYTVEAGPSAGQEVDLTRYQVHVQVRLVAAATGQVVWQETLKGTPPRACELRELFVGALPTGGHRIVGERLTFEAFELWLARFVLQP